MSMTRVYSLKVTKVLMLSLLLRAWPPLRSMAPASSAVALYRELLHSALEPNDVYPDP